jgi:hypothetical protein
MKQFINDLKKLVDKYYNDVHVEYSNKRLSNIPRRIEFIRVFFMDGLFTSLNRPEQMFNKMTDLPYIIDVGDLYINEESIIGFVRGLGFRGITSIVLFSENKSFSILV